MTLEGIGAGGGGYGAQGAGNKELFYRYALAVNGTVTVDEERVLGGQVQHSHGRGQGHGDDEHGFCVNGLHGRGDGWHGGHVGL